MEGIYKGYGSLLGNVIIVMEGIAVTGDQNMEN